MNVCMKLTRCQAYTARIGEVNSTVHAVTDINPEAIAIAEQLDEERKEGKVRGYERRKCLLLLAYTDLL